jgi:hypothetical protein
MGHELKIMEALLSGFGLLFCLWLFYGALKRSESPVKILSKVLLTVILLGGEIWLIATFNATAADKTYMSGLPSVFLLVASVAVAGIVLSILWTPHIGEWLVAPLTNLFDGGSEPPELRPAYSAAQTKRKNGQPLEAIVVIREQLAKFPNDFKGVTLLAEIQADDLNDLPGAALTLRRFCDAPGLPERQVIAILKRLADLHLNRTCDEDAALAIMEELMARFPEAEISRRTAQRLGRQRAVAGPLGRAR